ncbi:hypothetical protein AGRO_1745 [Agrobacterium sp. ATCC 31749]|nr:hypothetical protein AGRO_1745 [Agrobacterium sp. ATCC 31749]
MFPIKHGYVSSCVVFMRASLQKCRYVSNTDLSVFRIISASLHGVRHSPAFAAVFPDKARYTL